MAIGAELEHSEAFSGQTEQNLARALEVVNRFFKEGDIVYVATAEWRGRHVYIWARTPGDDCLMIDLNSQANGFPNTFNEWVSYLTDSIEAFFDPNVTRRQLIDLARRMDAEKLARDVALRQICGYMELIFENDESKKTAEEKILNGWIGVMAKNGLIVTGKPLEKLTRLPVLGINQILIHHASPQFSPRYFRVALGAKEITVTRIEAGCLADVPTGEVVGVDEMGNDELMIIRDALRSIAPEVEED